MTIQMERDLFTGPDASDFIFFVCGLVTGITYAVLIFAAQTHETNCHQI